MHLAVIPASRTVAAEKGEIDFRPFGMQIIGFGLATRKGRSRSVLSESKSSVSDWQVEREDRDPSFRNANHWFRIGNSKGKIAICPFGMQIIGFGLAT